VSGVSLVGLVVVSHSARLAAGVVEVVAQMAPDVTVVPAGGTADGGIGTDFDAVSAAVEQADGGAGVVVLYDLGSARMVAEMAVEVADNARLADAPLVEGTVAAAVSAQGGADVTEVAHAAEDAAGVPGATAPELAVAPELATGPELAVTPELATGSEQATAPDLAGPALTVVPDVAAVADVTAMPDGAVAPEPAAGGIPAGVDVAGGMSVATGKPQAPAEAVVTLTNEIGLHARPAAVVARAMTGLDATVTIRFGNAAADGRSVLALMALGARGGDEVRVTAVGPQAAEAIRTFQDLAASNFGT
jgi:PTS hybrid protein